MVPIHVHVGGLFCCASNILKMWYLLMYQRLLKVLLVKIKNRFSSMVENEIIILTIESDIQ